MEIQIYQFPPLLKASMPSEPVPANKSRTLTPTTCSGLRILNIALFTSDEVGRDDLSEGGINLRPFTVPPTTCINLNSYNYNQYHLT